MMLFEKQNISKFLTQMWRTLLNGRVHIFTPTDLTDPVHKIISLATHGATSYRMRTARQRAYLADN